MARADVVFMLRHRAAARASLLAAFAVVIAAAFTPGCAADTTSDDEDAFDDTGIDPADYQDDEGPSASTESELKSCNQCSNCVLYARCRQPRLPYGLTTYAQKVAHINRSTARAGCVAVIKTSSSYGHVAYVTSVSGSTVHIAEGNWPSGHCGTRSGTKAGLHITGYICP